MVIMTVFNVYEILYCQRGRVYRHANYFSSLELLELLRYLMNSVLNIAYLKFGNRTNVLICNECPTNLHELFF
jgi:hypothetical protein